MTDYIGDARGFYLHWWDEPMIEMLPVRHPVTFDEMQALRYKTGNVGEALARFRQDEPMTEGSCLEPVNTLEEARSVVMTVFLNRWASLLNVVRFDQESDGDFRIRIIEKLTSHQTE